MSQIAEPVIAGLEVVEHFGDARVVIARLMGKRVRGPNRPHRSGIAYRVVHRDVVERCAYKCLTGGGDVDGLRREFRDPYDCGALDAPCWIPAGSVESDRSSGWPSFAVRGCWC